MQAVVLVGGFGTRLASVTEKLGLPKPMVPVLGKPFLEYLLLMLKRKGFTNFILCTHHRADKIKDYFKEGEKIGIKISYSHEKKPLLSAGAIKLAEDHLENDFFVINGDDYFPLDFKNMFFLHKRKDALITISGKKWEKEYEGRYASFFSNEGNVEAYYHKDGEKLRKPNYAFFTCFLIKKSVIKSLPKNVPLSLEKDVLPKFVKTGRVFSYDSNANFSEIGTPESYQRFIQDVEKGVIKTSFS